ncbi:DUF1735 domain-containing protein [Mucilaginibacter sp.]
MKKTFYIKTALLSLIGIALLSSCLKDPRYVDFAGSKPLIELPGAAGVAAGGGYFETVGLLANASAPTAFNVPVNLAAPNPLSTPVTVKLSVNAAALTAYNTANGTNYTLMPAADYSSSLTVTIPAGQNLVNLVVNVNTSQITPANSYVLPLTITDGGGQQISNYNTILFAIVVKNAYDDNYTETGYKFHTTAGASHALTGTIAVTTVTAVTSNTAVGDLGGSGYTFNFDTNGSTVSNWVPEGSTPAAPASGFMTADNPGGFTYVTTDGSQPGTAPYTSSTYNNTYNATTKTFMLHYGYGVGSSGQNGYTRQFYSKLVAQ